MEAKIPRPAVSKLDTQESQWCKLQIKSKSKDRRRPMSQLEDSQAES